MPNVLIRGLDPATHRELVRRAELRGQSLQAYLTEQLDLIASMPTADDFWRRVSSRTGGSIGFERAAENIAAERDRR